MEEKKLIIGKFVAHEKGFGFVEPEGEDKQKDIFIPAKSVNGALNEDIVEIEIVDESGRSKEGKVVKIVRRGKDTLVGTFQNSKNLKCVFVLMDIRQIPSELDQQMLFYLYSNNIPFKVVATKTDKISKSKINSQINLMAKNLKITANNIIAVSSENKLNLQLILDFLNTTNSINNLF